VLAASNWLNPAKLLTRWLCVAAANDMAIISLILPVGAAKRGSG